MQKTPDKLFTTLEVYTKALVNGAKKDEPNGGVAKTIGYLHLNRPANLNALSLQVLSELIEAAHWFNTQPDVRVVVVSGRGRAFSAGADLQGFPKVGDENLREAADLGRQMVDAIEGMLAVTIAQLHGWCVGGGLVLAAACDIRIAADDTQFSIPEIDLGIPLAWGGIPRLVREIGPALTKELVMSCCVFSAQEAKQAGFLNRSIDHSQLDSQVVELAAQIAAKPKMPIQSTKQHVNAVTAGAIGLERSVADADALIGGLLDAECQQARSSYVRQLAKKSDKKESR